MFHLPEHLRDTPSHTVREPDDEIARQIDRRYTLTYSEGTPYIGRFVRQDAIHPHIQ